MVLIGIGRRLHIFALYKKKKSKTRPSKHVWAHYERENECIIAIIIVPGW